MATGGSQPDRRHPTARARHQPRDRTLAIATVALLLSGIFDVGRALYCRYRLGYAVTQSASLLSRRPAPATEDAKAMSSAAAELIRRISGLRDLPPSSVRVSRSYAAASASGTAPRMTVRARYTLPLLSPHVRALFRNGSVSLEAVATRPVPSTGTLANAMCSAV